MRRHPTPLEATATAFDGAGPACWPWVPLDEMRRLEEATGDEVDALFLAMMSRHHLGGAEMAEVASDEADDRYVRTRATWMARSQRSEIVEYSRTRQRLALPVPDGFTDPPTIPGGHDHHGD